MTDTEAEALVEAMARALAKADNIEICSDAQYRYSSYGIRAQAAAAVIAEAMAAKDAELDAAKAELEAFKREVSEAIQNYKADCDYKAYMALDRFILPAPDPLVDVLINQVGERLKINPHGTTWHDALREEIRGYEVRKIGEAGE